MPSGGVARAGHPTRDVEQLADDALEVELGDEPATRMDELPQAGGVERSGVLLAGLGLIAGRLRHVGDGSSRGARSGLSTTACRPAGLEYWARRLPGADAPGRRRSQHPYLAAERSRDARATCAGESSGRPVATGVAFRVSPIQGAAMVPDTAPETHDAPLRVLVAGGGVAGLEALLALTDMAADRVDVTLLCPQEDFVYRPLAVAEPFSMGRVHRYPLKKLTRDLGVRFVRGALDRVDADERLVTTVEGEPLGFEALLVATGAKAEVALEQALTWWPEGDPDAFGGLLRDLEQGYVRKVAFVVPPQVAWPLPAYELALMTAREVRSMGIDDAELTIVTPEDAPLGIFGKQAAEAVAAELAAAGVGDRDGRLRPGPHRRAARDPAGCAPGRGRERRGAASCDRPARPWASRR